MSIDFDKLVSTVRDIHNQLSRQAVKAVNISLTVRNWLIGYYIREYEQHGADRAKYGERILQRLSESLPQDATFSYRSLKLYRQFYECYQQIGQSVIAYLKQTRIGQPLLAQLPAMSPSEDMQSVSLKLTIPSERLLVSLSFTHFVELLKFDDPLKRAFYEIECIRGNWSVRELKRQIGSLYYERSGLSENKKKLAELAQSGAEQAEPKLAIRDPYVFEFLGIKPREIMGESDLEDALLDKLQDFLLELGHGFCFEARQKRLLIGDSHGFVDLVFYHRVLKCHILVELKIEEFAHENLGQLNTYVSWYKRNMMTDGDNPPIGILLCTQKDHALVEYALADMDNHLFVSKYQLELPNKEDIQRFLEEKMRELSNGD